MRTQESRKELIHSNFMGLEKSSLFPECCNEFKEVYRTPVIMFCHSNLFYQVKSKLHMHYITGPMQSNKDTQSLCCDCRWELYIKSSLRTGFEASKCRHGSSICQEIYHVPWKLLDTKSSSDYRMTTRNPGLTAYAQCVEGY